MKYRSKKLMRASILGIIITVIMSLITAYYIESPIPSYISLGLFVMFLFFNLYVSRCPYCGSLRASRHVSFNDAIVYYCPKCGEELHQK